MTTYRMHGLTDDTDTCEICGKVELRRVVMLMALDADGNDEEIVYAGTTCAARALAVRGTRTTAARVRDAAAAADRVHAQAREFVAEMDGLTFNQYLKANWIYAQNFGVQAARNSYDDLQVEVATLKTGTLTGTRFARLLPTL
jgi:hypothetical protein